MRQTVMGDRRNARIAGQHFVDATRRRITFKRRMNVRFEQRPYVRQTIGKLVYEVNDLRATRIARRIVPGSEVWPTLKRAFRDYIEEYICNRVIS